MTVKYNNTLYKYVLTARAISHLRTYLCYDRIVFFSVCFPIPQYHLINSMTKPWCPSYLFFCTLLLTCVSCWFPRYSLFIACKLFPVQSYSDESKHAMCWYYPGALLFNLITQSIIIISFILGYLKDSNAAAHSVDTDIS